MTMQEQNYAHEIRSLKRELRQARLETMILSSTERTQPLEGLAERLQTEFPSEHLVLVILHAKADLSFRHTVAAEDYSPANQNDSLRPVVYYTGETLTETEALCQKHLLPRNMYILFRADMDLGILICPDRRYVAEEHVHSGNYLKEISGQISLLISDMNRVLSLENTATISRIWTSHANLREMYMETRTTYDYSWNQSGGVFTYDDYCATPMSPGDRMIICSMEEEFQNDISHLLFDEAFVVLSNILSTLFQHSVPLSEIVISMTARLRNVLTVLEYTAGVPSDTTRSLQGLLQMVSASVSIPELQDRIFDFFTESRNITPSAGAKRSTQILEFIEANSKNPNLNAQMICDRFHISRTYVSKLIKKETGFGLVDTLHRVWVEHAKTLLKTTDLTIEQIAVQTGFTNRYGMLRAFRSQENTTPGEYRAGFKGEESVHQSMSPTYNITKETEEKK